MAGVRQLVDVYADASNLQRNTLEGMYEAYRLGRQAYDTMRDIPPPAELMHDSDDSEDGQL